MIFVTESIPRRHFILVWKSIQKIVLRMPASDIDFDSLFISRSHSLVQMLQSDQSLLFSLAKQRKDITEVSNFFSFQLNFFLLDWTIY